METFQHSQEGTERPKKPESKTEKKEKQTEAILGPDNRNYLQLALMKKMYDKMPSDEEILSWIPKYAEAVAEIIDAPENQEIRELALSDRHDEAAEKVLAILKEKELDRAA